MSLHLALVALVAFAATALCAWVFTRTEHPLIPIDRPNHRSLHSHPIARIGGVAIAVGVALAWLLPPLAGVNLPWNDSERSLTTLLAAALVLVVVCFIDDHRSLPVSVRFATHFGCAGAALAAIAPGTLHLGPSGPLAALMPAWVLWALLVLAMVWITNLYNFMDGSDGLAGSVTIIGFATLGFAAWEAEALATTLACAAVAGAASAFLLFNWSPARAFMGDTGSIPLGFLAASIGVAGWAQGLWPLVFMPLAFAPFVLDASVTLLRRLARGERIWQAHRSHTYQRLVLMGCSHAQVARLYAAATFACSLAALGLRYAPTAVLASGVVAIVVVLLVAGLLIDRRWRQHAA